MPRFQFFRKFESEKYPTWSNVLKKGWDLWESAVKTTDNHKLILLATGVGGHIPVVTLDSLLAAALTLRGAKVNVLLCDQALPACEHITYYSVKDLEFFARNGLSKKICQGCFYGGDKAFKALQIPVHYYSQYVSMTEIDEAERISSIIPFESIGKYRTDGLPVGEHALAGALRFFASGNLETEPLAEPILRHYFKAALLSRYIFSRFLRMNEIQGISFHHGIYIPQGILGEVARKEAVNIFNWQVAYRKKSFIFSHGDTYHHTMLSEPVSSWENIPWTPEMEKDLLYYLKSRWQGDEDWIYFHNKPEFDQKKIMKELGLDTTKPIIGLLTNVIWDAQLHYPANAFANMEDWIVETIQYFSKRPELQLVIRIHPAEIQGTIRSRQNVADLIYKRVPNLQKNIVIIPPENRISTYVIMAECNAAIIYGTKTGVELTCMGIPTIVGGEAWIRNKGLTLDANTQEDYFKILDQLPFADKMFDESILRAKKYAYHFFFRRMIPIDCIDPAPGWPPYMIKLEKLEQLNPGQDLGLDTICEGILNGSPFIYPSETIQRAR